VLHGLDLRAAGLGTLLAKLVGFRRARAQRLLAVPDRDRHALAALAIDHEVRVGEAVDRLERRSDVGEALQETVAVSAVRADACVHRCPPFATKFA
jgi:hypothetical protein